MLQIYHIVFNFLPRRGSLSNEPSGLAALLVLLLDGGLLLVHERAADGLERPDDAAGLGRDPGVRPVPPPSSNL